METSSCSDSGCIHQECSQTPYKANTPTALNTPSTLTILNLNSLPGRILEQILLHNMVKQYDFMNEADEAHYARWDEDRHEPDEEDDF